MARSIPKKGATVPAELVEPAATLEMSAALNVVEEPAEVAAFERAVARFERPVAVCKTAMPEVSWEALIRSLLAVPV